MVGFIVCLITFDYRIEHYLSIGLISLKFRMCFNFRSLTVSTIQCSHATKSCRNISGNQMIEVDVINQVPWVSDLFFWNVLSLNPLKVMATE